MCIRDRCNGAKYYNLQLTDSGDVDYLVSRVLKQVVFCNNGDRRKNLFVYFFVSTRNLELPCPEVFMLVDFFVCVSETITPWTSGLNWVNSGLPYNWNRLLKINPLNIKTYVDFNFGNACFNKFGKTSGTRDIRYFLIQSKKENKK